MVFKFIHLFTSKEDIAIFSKKWFNYLPTKHTIIIYENTKYYIDGITFNLNTDTIEIRLVKYGELLSPEEITKIGSAYQNIVGAINRKKVIKPDNKIREKT